MCFHNALSVESQKLEHRYHAVMAKDKSFQPIYHAAAFENPVWPVIKNSSPDCIQLLHWGLIPALTKNFQKAEEIRRLTYNARSESMFKKQSFSDVVQSRRCLVPSTGFFEWQHVGKQKIPWFIYLQDIPVFSMAGIWDTWEDSNSKEILSTFSILTTEANPLMQNIHNSKKRMPVILLPSDEKKWIDHKISNDEIMSLCKPLDEKYFKAHTVYFQLAQKNGQTNVPEIQKKFNHTLNGTLF